MEFIEPRQKLGSPVSWSVSDRTKSIVKYYAEYAEYTEDEIVDRFLVNLLEDEKFKKWINVRRRKKRMMQQLYPDHQTEVKPIEEA